MDRLLRTTGIAALAVVVLLVVDACASNAGEMLADAGTMLMDASAEGGLLHDAGLMLHDAGNAISDSGQDAGAQSGGVDSQSGSRLTARRVVYMGADGSRYDTGETEFTDTQLGMKCSRNFYPMTDGSYRCTPINPLTPMNFGNAYYSDSECSVALAYRSMNDCIVEEGALMSTSSVGQTCMSETSYVTRVFRLGARHVGTYYVRSGVNCVSQTQTGATEFYAIDSEVPPSDFVLFTDAP